MGLLGCKNLRLDESDVGHKVLARKYGAGIRLDLSLIPNSTRLSENVIYISLIAVGQWNAPKWNRLHETGTRCEAIFTFKFVQTHHLCTKKVCYK
jgi:hypothetical protein